MKQVGKLASNIRVGMMPQFTTVHHPVREKFGLSMMEYCIIDSIDVLSNNPNHPYCTTRREDIADWLRTTRQTVQVTIKKGVGLGLIEKQEGGKGLRSTEKWIANVQLYDAQK